MDDEEFDSGYDSDMFEDNNNFINDDINNIDMDYYNNKNYDNISTINDIDIKFNMNLCLEYECMNKSALYEDLCQDHIDEQQTIIYEYFDYDISDFIFIEKNIIKEYLYDRSLDYIKDIIYLEKEIDKNKTDSTFISINKAIELINEFIKPDLKIMSFFGKVGYLDEKIELYNFPIKDKDLYKHIYNNCILYYKHVYNKDPNGRHIEPYVAYICCIENDKQIFKTISFIKLFNILNLIYNKESIINHIYDITYNRFNIKNLLN